jgi:uncharacterized membrane protein
MQFAVPLPWWVLVLMAAAIAVVAWASYSGAIVPLRPAPRAALSTLRALTLLLLVACLLRPVRVVPPDASTNAVVPILVDASRSMTLADAGGRPRFDAARSVLQTLGPALDRFQTEVWTFGSALVRQEGELPRADQGRSDLSGALRSLYEHYRERPIAGVVVISDGGDTGTVDAAATVDSLGAPVFTVGVGMPRVAPDLEITDVSAGETVLTDTSVDLSVAAVSRGRGEPFDLRVLENGRPLDVRSVTPAADGSPVHTTFTVSPPRDNPSVYTVEIPSASGELVLENNRRSVLVEPPGRRRRVLIVEGAPGFEHTFLKRALAADSGIELDAVVRKGRDAQGESTYFVQASEARAPKLGSGFPLDRESLYQYDAVILANIDGDALSNTQLETTAAFVGERGGGLLVLGARSFAQPGLAGTAIEEVLPVGLTDRGNGVVQASVRSEAPFTVSVTPDGQQHPVTRFSSSTEETIKRWSTVPALADATPLGALRPGAQALAIVRTPDGSRPLVAVQRYGQGRAMVFTGEASWRWRMQLPSEDRTHELFWRQTTRWLSAGAPDPVSIVPLTATVPGSSESVHVDVRNAAFQPVSDAQVTLRLTVPGGEIVDARPVLTDPRTGRYTAEHRFDQPGIYRINAEARRGSVLVGSTERWVLVGGADPEMTDPRLNEDVLRRIATAGGGEYFTADDISGLPALLTSSQSQPAPQLQDLWHTPWIFALAVALLAAEWVLRRRWGLR